MFSKLKRMVKEPKIYALIVESEHGQALHLGVHFSLEEAYAVARARMETLIPHRPGQAMNIDLWNTLSARQVIAQLMDPAWANELVPGGEKKELSPEEKERIAAVNNGDLPQEIGALLTSFSTNQAADEKPPEVIEKKDVVLSTVNDHVKEIKKKKNLLMKKLIDDGSISQAEKLKSFLGTNSFKYVLRAIEKKNKV